MNKWEVTTLGDIFNFNGGGTPDRREVAYWNGDISWASVKDIKGNYLFNTVDKITELGLESSSSTVAKPGELILVTRINPGKTIIARTEVAINQDLKIARSKRKVSPLFFHHWFRASERKIINLASGTTVKGITLNDLKNIKVHLPDYSTQCLIVQKIEELFSELDKGVEQLKILQQQLKVYRQAVLKHAFEGKLTEEWRKLNPPSQTAEELLEQIKAEREKQAKKQGKKLKQVAPLTEEELGELPELPKGWGVARLSQIGEWNGGGTPSKSNLAFWSEGSIPWVSPKDIKCQFIDSTEDRITEAAIINSSTKLINEGSVLFVVRSGILRRTLPIAINIVPVTLNQDMQALSPLCISPKYIYYYALSSNQEIRQKCTKDGTTVESIDTTLLKSFPIPIADINEQEQIVKEIEAKLSVCDKLEETIQDSLKQAEALRQSILKKAFSGEFVKEEELD